MKMKVFLPVAFLAAIVASCTQSNKPDVIGQYPVSEKVDTVDTYFGIEVADPYRWMENDTSQQTAAWVKAQNEVTFGFLDKIPYRAQVKNRLEALNNYQKLGSPFQKGDYIYFYKNDGLQNHYVLYRKKGDQAEDEVFLDPNSFSADGTTRLAGVSFSKDGSRVAFQVSKGGADWTGVGDRERVQDGRQLAAFELDVDDCADDLGDLPDVTRTVRCHDDPPT